jgi:phenol 2-monooxygenase
LQNLLANQTAPALHKVFFDDESYNSGHGHAYEAYGIDPAVGAMIIVRPDQCESLLMPASDLEARLTCH